MVIDCGAGGRPSLDRPRHGAWSLGEDAFGDAMERDWAPRDGASRLRCGEQSHACLDLPDEGAAVILGRSDADQAGLGRNGQSCGAWISNDEDRDRAEAPEPLKRVLQGSFMLRGYPIMLPGAG
jgi:hypothetical protein